VKGFSMTAGNEASITELLESAKTIAVVGLSSKPHRASFGVAQYLQSCGYRVIPVNPNETEVLGEKCYARLENVPEKIDIVDIFRRSELVAEVVDAAIRIGARGARDSLSLWISASPRNFTSGAGSFTTQTGEERKIAAS
jgi:predicted CoA-binding protein